MKQHKLDNMMYIICKTFASVILLFQNLVHFAPSNCAHMHIFRMQCPLLKQYKKIGLPIEILIKTADNVCKIVAKVTKLTEKMNKGKYLNYYFLNTDEYNTYSKYESWFTFMRIASTHLF